MRIYYIAAYMSKFPSREANSINSIRMCEAFSNLGHEIALCVRDLGVSESEILQHYGILKRIPIFKIKCLIPKINRVLYSVRAVLLAKNSSAELIISRSTIPCAFAALFKIDTVLDLHGPIWEKNIVERFCYKYLIKNKYLRLVTTNSLALKKMFIEKGLVPNCGITVANNGVSMIETNLKEQESISWPGREGSLQVGYTGHLYEGRGVEVILDVARKLANVDFHFIGGTNFDIEKWKNVTDLANVYYHGFVLPTKVYLYRNRCDVLLAPYQDKITVAGGRGDTSKYMCPIKIIEYISSKKAIVASDMETIRDILPESCAIFVKSRDIEGWVQAIEKLIIKSNREKIEKSLDAYFTDEFSWEKRASKLLKWD